MATPFHEGKAIDAVITWLEARDSLARDDGRDPEAEKHPQPIDYACKLGGQLFAFEHTGIEAFPDQLKLNVDTAALLDPVVEKLEGVAPADEFLQLLLPIDATVGLKAAQVARIQEALEQYVRAAAPKIEPVPYGRRGKFSPAKLDGVPFEVTLRRYSDARAMGGRFFYMRVVSGDDEAARVERLATACAKKFGKLAAWKGVGARSVLIFEDVDISLSNETLIARALREAEKGKGDQPDEVYLVNACTSIWFVTCLRRAGKSYLDDGGDGHFEVNPEKLAKLTPR